jgi:hypothetical protein
MEKAQTIEATAISKYLLHSVGAADIAVCKLTL